jgi:hypothetical protein
MVPAKDYYEDNDQAWVVRTLGPTRMRQAEVILQRLRPRLAAEDGLLDYGSGLGFFVRKARQSGIQHVAGADVSSIALDHLRQDGIPGISLAPTHASLDAELRQKAPFAARAVSFLDVLEHFDANPVLLLRDWLRTTWSGLQYLVIKVPVSNGSFYRLANAVRRIGMVGPIKQLYQVGSVPPHFNYFSRRSLGLWFDQVGLRVVDQWGDRDFEPDSLLDRLRFSVPRLPSLARWAGRLVAVGVETAGLFDSCISVLEIDWPKLEKQTSHASSSAYNLTAVA